MTPGHSPRCPCLCAALPAHLAPGRRHRRADQSAASTVCPAQRGRSAERQVPGIDWDSNSRFQFWYWLSDSKWLWFWSELSSSPDSGPSLSGSVECSRCPERFWSSPDHTECIPQQVDFLSLSDSMGIVLSVISVVGATLTAATLITFICHRHTPLVRVHWVI